MNLTKIDMIKIVRIFTALCLKDAKDATDLFRMAYDIGDELYKEDLYRFMKFVSMLVTGDLVIKGGYLYPPQPKVILSDQLKVMVDNRGSLQTQYHD
jgi:hypothetical protein